MKTFKVYITVEQKMIMQVEADSNVEAVAMAQRLIDNGTYATENDNCYDGEISINDTEEIIKSNDIDASVVEDNKNYLADIED